MTRPVIGEADPFELPEWLGLGEVEWTTTAPVAGAGTVTGRLSQGTQSLPADLLAADRAYPVISLGEEWRTPAHQAWTHGEVLLLEVDGRLTLAVPGHALTVDLTLEALRRLARAVGVPPHRFVVALRL
ncbi:hypothetical protein [Nocardioides massiliensis]|uniref:Uncharacterized protein n=1 Tax=Nocardioides massiliensis TaxID=1325935 RepID=A0ABT9NRG5_9ACTN|nr:hypothetical protein [Nocardioides massiliensis]MDP9823014.1 hypothetical protein [Nocardioides massiliensis]